MTRSNISPERRDIHFATKSLHHRFGLHTLPYLLTLSSVLPSTSFLLQELQVFSAVTLQNIDWPIPKWTTASILRGCPKIKRAGASPYALVLFSWVRKVRCKNERKLTLETGFQAFKAYFSDCTALFSMPLDLDAYREESIFYTLILLESV